MTVRHIPFTAEFETEVFVFIGEDLKHTLVSREEWYDVRGRMKVEQRLIGGIKQAEFIEVIKLPDHIDGCLGTIFALDDDLVIFRRTPRSKICASLLYFAQSVAIEGGGVFLQGEGGHQSSPLF